MPHFMSPVSTTLFWPEFWQKSLFFFSNLRDVLSDSESWKVSERNNALVECIKPQSASIYFLFEQHDGLCFRVENWNDWQNLVRVRLKQKKVFGRVKKFDWCQATFPGQEVVSLLELMVQQVGYSGSSLKGSKCAAERLTYVLVRINSW